MQPNKLNIAKWIVALRSGKYQQAQSALKKNGGYCCLGVVCDISKQGTWRGYAYHTKGQVDSAFLPSAVVSWLGLSDTIPQVTAQADAVEANDIQGMSFTEIADYLEGLYLKGKKAQDVVEAASAESEAWRKLAELFDSQADDCSPYLCDAINRQHTNWPYLAADDVRLAMLDRIRFQIAGEFSAYPDADGVTVYEGSPELMQEVKEARVLACLMFAEQAADGVA